MKLLCPKCCSYGGCALLCCSAWCFSCTAQVLMHLVLSVMSSKAEWQSDDFKGHGEGWELLHALLQRVVLSCGPKLEGTCSAQETSQRDCVEVISCSVMGEAVKLSMLCCSARCISNSGTGRPD